MFELLIENKCGKVWKLLVIYKMQALFSCLQMNVTPKVINYLSVQRGFHNKIRKQNKAH